MPTTKFDAASVPKLSLPPGKAQIDYFERLHQGRSLILTVNRGGKLTWSAQFYKDGKPRRAPSWAYGQP